MSQFGSFARGAPGSGRFYNQAGSSRGRNDGFGRYQRSSETGQKRVAITIPPDVFATLRQFPAFFTKLAFDNEYKETILVVGASYARELESARNYIHLLCEMEFANICCRLFTEELQKVPFDLVCVGVTFLPFSSIDKLKVSKMKLLKKSSGTRFSAGVVNRFKELLSLDGSVFSTVAILCEWFKNDPA
uniref:Uncharacterized protein n=1 Tax=Panagrolaimus superbus TaxID=310955 RepID=A0A914ZAF5_9BILA